MFSKKHARLFFKTWTCFLKSMLVFFFSIFSSLQERPPERKSNERFPCGLSL